MSLKVRPLVVEPLPQTALRRPNSRTGDRAMKLTTANVHGLSVVSIIGSVDFYTSPSLRRAVSSLMADGSEHIVFDLSKVKHLDRSGIAVLVGTATQQRYAHRGCYGGHSPAHAPGRSLPIGRRAYHLR